MRTTIALASTCIALLLAGCGGTDALVCDPACPAGTHCDATGCIPDNPNDVVDMAAPGGDIAMACSPACAGLNPYCNASHQCVPCLEDKNCPAGQVCKTAGATSSCVPGCVDDSRCAGAAGDGGVGGAMKCCAGHCIDVSKDPQNCGACNMACGVQHSSALCQNGACKPGTCDTGWGDCNMNPMDGCESNLHIDAKNCGACGTACAIPNAVAGCSDTCYIAACNFGFDDCNGDVKDGCELPVSADVKNCGGCGMACGMVAHAKNTCINAACQLTSCDQGYSDCNGTAKDGCEVATGTDAANCGKCGNQCQQGLVCINSSCTCPMCNIPNSKTKCVNNQCVWDSCLPGWGDCDNNVGNGCEVNLGTDPKNCSACGMACPQNTPYCFQMACQAKLPGVLIGTINGQDYYKVQVMGAMTDTNVFAACTNSGFRVPCQAGAPGSCQYDDNACVMSQENSCGNPMIGLAQKVCNGANPPSCPALYNCFQYMGHKWVADSACGAQANNWCVQGSGAQNGFAVCVM